MSEYNYLMGSTTLNEYQEAAKKMAVYPGEHAINYPILGLVGEAGELANKYKKVIRDSNGIINLETQDAMQKELGDVLWYVAAIASDLGTSLERIAQMNLGKLKSRQDRGRIHGSGDNR